MEIPPLIVTCLRAASLARCSGNIILRIPFCRPPISSSSGIPFFHAIIFLTSSFELGGPKRTRASFQIPFSLSLPSSICHSYLTLSQTSSGHFSSIASFASLSASLLSSLKICQIVKFIPSRYRIRMLCRKCTRAFLIPQMPHV